ncbi:hypothetical protein [Microvirga calopogonii]|uniref:hypothetical protein n=1 Tax=Microvirga calopogonii TaxID=2078013 RepID=UPI0013B43043|nr:hypothetical protein [Microvirga calopogonii]
MPQNGVRPTGFEASNSGYTKTLSVMRKVTGFKKRRGCVRNWSELRKNVDVRKIAWRRNGGGPTLEANRQPADLPQEDLSPSTKTRI